MRFLLFVVCASLLQVALTAEATAKTSRIISGSRVVIQPGSTSPQVTWQVYFLSGGSACGGAILNETFVITAGHCCRRISGSSQSTTLASQMSVRPGQNRRGGEPSYQVEEFWIHPSYGSGTTATQRIDLALLKLRDPIRFNSNVQPIAMADSTICGASNCETDGTQVVVSGYGNTQSTSSGSNSAPADDLQWVPQRVEDLGDCDRAAPFSLPINVFCAGDALGCTQAPCDDSCTGDSGGPVALNRGTSTAQNWVLTGIVQSGTVVQNEGLPQCGAPNEYGVYTSVSQTRAWIDDVLAGRGGPPTDNTQGGGSPSSNPFLCLHEESLISYKGRPARPLKLFAEGIEAECLVPHVVEADGLRIETDCASTPLRLSKEHMVFSTAGVVEAHALRVGDRVYHDVAESGHCAVLSVTADPGQRYMGLNCYESAVVADGVKVSTFEKHHVIPSLWMHYVPKVLGLRGASKLGETLTNLLRKVNLA